MGFRIQDGGELGTCGRGPANHPGYACTGGPDAEEIQVADGEVYACVRTGDEFTLARYVIGVPAEVVAELHRRAAIAADRGDNERDQRLTWIAARISAE